MTPILLFDLDGTLIDSTEAIVDGFYTAFHSFNEPKPQEKDITELIGYTLEDIFSMLGVDESLVDAHVLAYKARYREISHQKTVLIPGAAQALEIASTFATLGVVTTKTSRYSKELLEHLGIMKHFKTLIGREDVKNVKPDPEPIEKALANLGKFDTSAKKLIWMIGDTMMDIDAAKNAGVNHVGLLTGYGDKNVLKSSCNKVTADVLEAVRYIKLENKS